MMKVPDFELWHQVETTGWPQPFQWMAHRVGSISNQGEFWFESEKEARDWIVKQRESYAKAVEAHEKKYGGAPA